MFLFVWIIVMLELILFNEETETLNMALQMTVDIFKDLRLLCLLSLQNLPCLFSLRHLWFFHYLLTYYQDISNIIALIYNSENKREGEEDFSLSFLRGWPNQEHLIWGWGKVEQLWGGRLWGQRGREQRPLPHTAFLWKSTLPWAHFGSQSVGWTITISFSHLVVWENM